MIYYMYAVNRSGIACEFYRYLINDIISTLYIMRCFHIRRAGASPAWNPGHYPPSTIRGRSSTGLEKWEETMTREIDGAEAVAYELFKAVCYAEGKDIGLTAKAPEAK